MKNSLRTAAINPIEELKKRISVLKPNLPANYRTIFFEENPQYDNHKGVALLNNVLYLKSTDVFITDALEEIVERKNKMRAV
jgi:hypothetical protein